MESIIIETHCCRTDSRCGFPQRRARENYSFHREPVVLFFTQPPPFPLIYTQLQPYRSCWCLFLQRCTKKGWCNKNNIKKNLANRAAACGSLLRTGKHFDSILQEAGAAVATGAAFCRNNTPTSIKSYCLPARGGCAVM